MIETSTSDNARRRSVRTLLAPSSVAIVGASRDPTRIGGMIVRLLRVHGFTGDVYPINPNCDELHGFRCYETLDALPPDAGPDVVFVNLPAAGVPDVVAAAGERGAGAAVVISSGFAEVGGDGARLQRELTAAADRYGLAVCGPNCAGIANFGTGFVAYGTTNFIDLDHIQKGSVAVLTASGGFGNTIFTYLQARGIGVSHLVGLGNEAVTTAAGYLDALVDDPAVSAIIANLEAIRDPTLFFSAADRAADAGKPIIALKAGRSTIGRESIRTHTAALAGSPEAVAGAFAKHGVIQVHDLDELADCAMLVTRVRACAGRRLGVFSLAGGGTGLLSDLANDHGFEVPALEHATTAALSELLPPIAAVRNPVDPAAGFGRDREKLSAAIHAFASDPNLDQIVFFPLASQVDYAQQLADTVVSLRDELAKPLIVIWTAGRALQDGAWRTLHDAGVPLFTRTAAALAALARCRGSAEALTRRADPAAADFGPHRGVRPRVGPDAPAAQLTAELQRFGVRFPRSELAMTAERAAELVTAFGCPTAIKIASPDISHKTEVGGVRLGITTAAQARTAFARIRADVAQHAPEARIDGVEVQELVGDGVEMLVGVSTEDEVGPVVTVGFGGVLAELLSDTITWPVPISRADAREMLSQLRGAPLLRGFRGGAPADVEALIETILGVSALAEGWRAMGPEFELNPVVVLPTGAGALAVDTISVGLPRSEKGVD